MRAVAELVACCLPGEVRSPDSNRVRRQPQARQQSQCTGCGKCVRACGQNVYALVEVNGSKKAMIVNGGECLGDCHCCKACPTGALIRGRDAWRFLRMREWKGASWRMGMTPVLPVDEYTS